MPQNRRRRATQRKGRPGPTAPRSWPPVLIDPPSPGSVPLSRDQATRARDFYRAHGLGACQLCGAPLAITHARVSCRGLTFRCRCPTPDCPGYVAGHLSPEHARLWRDAFDSPPDP
ncbi:unnamed protein product [marine sediment metagenome]|uniref:Uncharacterized protein n=1 Tax=marine sediment metagenome TaxID=412755 RepID=X1QTE4_9ZZZZ